MIVRNHKYYPFDKIVKDEKLTQHEVVVNKVLRVETAKLMYICEVDGKVMIYFKDSSMKSVTFNMSFEPEYDVSLFNFIKNRYATYRVVPLLETGYFDFNNNFIK